MDLEQVKSVYFIGIGGIGMSAIARYFMAKGKRVAGYDRSPSELTARLETEGAEIHYHESVERIPAYCRGDHDSVLVIYTPAIPETHAELVYFTNQGFQLMKRAQVLGLITRAEKALCVAGTHGKTTTSTMLAHLIHQSESCKCDAFLGGISKNYGTNCLLDKDSDYVVVEADEFDRSFHHLQPFMTVITSAEPDHLDIYHTPEAYIESFVHYTTLVRQGGYLIMHHKVSLTPSPAPGVKVYTYGREEGDFHAGNIRIGGGEIWFDYHSPLGDIYDVNLGVPVSINIDNGIAAMAMAQLAGVSDEDIKRGMATFRGVDRRFDFKLKRTDKVYLSDYAHHPSEIRQSALSLKELYAEKRITAVFQPHLYSRTRDFYQEFAESLSLFDEVILLDIYPARELPIPGVTSQLIYDHLDAGVIKTMCRKDELLDLLKAHDGLEVLVTLGAGDIEDMAQDITRILE